MSRGRTVPVAVLAFVVSIFGVTPAAASTGPDPLGLLPGAGATEQLGLGTDVVTVWICESPEPVQHDPDHDFTVAEVVDWANDDIAPFFTLISGGRYEASFVVGGAFEGERAYDDPLYASACVTEARAMTPTSNTMVIDRSTSAAGFGGQGAYSVVGGVVFPARLDESAAETRRGFWIGGGVFGRPGIAAHELGHTLAWPHSGSADDGTSAEYDNQMDLMSGIGTDDDDFLYWDNFCDGLGPCEIIHTLAINHYASGWLDVDDIELILQDGMEVDLDGPESGDGTRLALLPTPDPEVYVTVEARPGTGYDAILPIEGVVVHEIDTGADCQSVVLICWGTSRRQQAAVPAADSDAHVIEVGEQLTLHGVTIEVTAATAHGFRVSFDGAPTGCGMGPNRFTDVFESSFAYESIACIRLLGITTGTSPTTYSPADLVTREQMAAFLGRLVRLLGAPCEDAATPFVDVPESSFAFDDVSCIYQLGITQGTSPTTYAPARFVTREEMAAFLARVWLALGNVCPAGPTPFTDVPPTSLPPTTWSASTTSESRRVQARRRTTRQARSPANRWPHSSNGFGRLRPRSRRCQCSGRWRRPRRSALSARVSSSTSKCWR